MKFPFVGHYVNPTKIQRISSRTWTAIKMTSDGRRHLGRVIGTNEKKNTYIDKKIDEECKEIDILSTTAATEPHAA